MALHRFAAVRSDGRVFVSSDKKTASGQSSLFFCGFGRLCSFRCNVPIEIGRQRDNENHRPQGETTMATRVEEGEHIVFWNKLCHRSPQQQQCVELLDRTLRRLRCTRISTAPKQKTPHRPVVIINPNLKDRPSSGGVMQVRGRGERMSFAESFKDIYNFRLLYGSSVSFFPIKVWKEDSCGLGRLCSFCCLAFCVCWGLGVLL